MSLYVSNTGKDDNSADGTISKPFKTLTYTLTKITTEDTIIFLEGSYENPETDIDIDGLTIKSESNNKVIFDGTKNINELKEPGASWEKMNHMVCNENGSETTNTTIYRIKVKDTTQIWQLFDERDEIINARFPSAQWKDNSVFDRYNSWGHGYKDNATNGAIPYNNGEILDYSNNVIDLYNYVKKIQTSIDTNFSLAGVLAHLNVGSYKTFTKEIINMHLDDTKKEIRLTYPIVDLWKTKHHYYYLENHLQFLNSQNEWYFDNTEKYLYVRLFGEKNPNNVNIRAKFQTYALNIINHNVKILDINFFGTTLKVSKNNVDISNCNFLYPSCYAHSLNKTNYTNTDTTFDNTTLVKSGSNCSFYNCAFSYTDGIALEMWGGSNTLENCYFSYIDKTVTNLSSVMTTVRLNGTNNVVKNNTFYMTGASSTLNSGELATIEYNNLSQSGFLQSDGAMIHVMVNQQTNVKIRFNWCHDSIKYGIRFDGEGAGHTGYIHHNVVWNCEGGIMVKGGELSGGQTVGGHFVYNNTVFNSLDQGKNDIMVLNTQGKDSNGIPIPINFGSIVMNNLAERISGERSALVDLSVNMYNGTNYMPGNVEDVINSFESRDFRPLNVPEIIDQGDITTTNAINYVSSLSTHNPAAELQFSPGNGLDKLTKDIGALNFDSTLWSAGITWNVNSLTGSLLNAFVFSTRLSMYAKTAETNITNRFSYFSKQQRVSTLNTYYKRILNKRVMIYQSNATNVGGNYESYEQHRDGSNDRLLRLKTRASRKLF